MVQNSVSKIEKEIILIIRHKTITQINGDWYIYRER